PPTGGGAASHPGRSAPSGPVGPLCPALQKCSPAGPPGGEIVSRHDIAQRWAAGRARLGVAPNKPQPRRKHERISRCRSMGCRPGVGDGAFGKPPSLVDSPKPPQREGIIGFRCDPVIVAESIGEIGMARLVVELDGLLKMLMSAGKVA